MFKIGFIVNPVAGIGGPAGLKGSDGEAVYQQAKRLGFESQSLNRAKIVISLLDRVANSIELVTCAGNMGEICLKGSGLTYLVAYKPADNAHTTSGDTIGAVQSLLQYGVDIILFVGGDGTARDVCSAVTPSQPVLGIPAGVKMHSGVFAVTPKAAALLVINMIEGALVSVACHDVRDIDEDAFRAGVVKSRYYGEMLTPQEGGFLQHVKCGGVEVEALVLDDIAAEVVEQMESGVLYVIGSGGTTKHIKDTLCHSSGAKGATLLGIDLFLDHELLVGDVNEHELHDWLQKFPSRLVVTIIGGQGILFGRGNQQLSPRNLRKIGLGNIDIVASKSKIKALQGRALSVDTGDDKLDRQLAGLRKIITGYDDRIVYPVEYFTGP